MTEGSGLQTDSVLPKVCFFVAQRGAELHRTPKGLFPHAVTIINNEDPMDVFTIINKADQNVSGLGVQRVVDQVSNRFFERIAYARDSILCALGIWGACRKLNSGILVMQSAQDWATENVPAAFDGAKDRCIFLQG